jgi:uncharacterized membrane protein YeaQ/YmgE (transglycosylase-associated protein family)
VILLFILVWGMFAGWIAHLLLARNQPVNWAELLVVGLAGSFVGGCSSACSVGTGWRCGRAASSARSWVRRCSWQPGRGSGEAPAAGRGDRAARAQPTAWRARERRGGLIQDTYA